MKFWKSILLSVCSFLAVATTVTYTSCEKDACTDLTCRNGGACAEGFCRCKTGFEGTECELRVVTRFVGTYIGYNHCYNSPALIDTMDVYVKTEPNIVGFYRRSDSSVNKMEGVAVGNNIIVDDFTSGNYRRNITGIVDGNELTVRDEVYQNGKKTTCNFVGTKLVK